MMVRPVLENSIIFFKIKGFAQLLLFSSFHRFLICIVACVFSFSGVCFMEVNVYFYILFGSLNKSQSSQVCEPHPHRIYKDDPVPALAETEADLEDHLPAEGRRHPHHLHLPLHHPDSPHHLPHGRLHAHRWAGHL